jgi:hypothetical protein
MENTTANIYGIDFSRLPDENNVLDYLNKIKSELGVNTNGILVNQIECYEGYIGEDGEIEGSGIVLKNYRRKLFSVIAPSGKFPVNIYCNVDEHSDKGVSEVEFLSKVKDILSKDAVRDVVINLYRQSV